MGKYADEMLAHIEAYEDAKKLDVILYKRKTLETLYIKLRGHQQKFFNRLYKSVKEVKESQLTVAIMQCANAIEKNDNDFDINCIFSTEM